MDLSDLGQEPIASKFECVNELFDSIRGSEVLD